MGNEKNRVDRMRIIFDSVKRCTDAGIGCNSNKIMSIIMVDMGISKKTAKDYITTLIAAGKIIQKDGELFINYKGVEDG